MQDHNQGVRVSVRMAHPCDLCELLLSLLSQSTRGTPAVRGTLTRQCRCEVAKMMHLAPEKNDRRCHKVLYLCLDLTYQAFPSRERSWHAYNS